MRADQLDGIIADCLPKLAAVMGELHPRILDAAAAAIEATQDSDDAKPKVAISLRLVIDLNTRTPAWHVEGAVGVRYKAVSEITQKDDEPSLPGFGEEGV